MATKQKAGKMRQRSLRNLKVSSIGMGSAQTYDVYKDEDIAVRGQIMDACIDEGVTLIDTSPMYGRAEEVIGKVIEGRRDKFQLATKVWAAGKETGRAQIARSFELMKTDHIELIQIHNLVDWETHLPYLEKLKSEGKIDLIGITYGYPDMLPEMMRIMKTKRVDTIQVSYNLKDRAVEKEVIPLAAELGMGVLVMRPTGKGSLATGLKRQPEIGPLAEFGIETWGQAALAWLLADPRIGVPIPATTKPSRIAENALPGKIAPLPKEMRDYIEKETARCS
jgi:aryl-alcohol dehydrogenase-like predicted oxidoreductase